LNETAAVAKIATIQKEGISQTKKLSFPRKRESRETLTLNPYLLHQGAISVFCD